MSHFSAVASFAMFITGNLKIQKYLVFQNTFNINYKKYAKKLLKTIEAGKNYIILTRKRMYDIVLTKSI